MPALAVLVMSGSLFLSACTTTTAEAQSTQTSPLTVSATPLAPSSSPTSTSSPASSPTGTWSPSPDDTTGPTAAAPQPTSSAALTEPVTFTTEITVRLVEVEALSVTAQTPGETTGPAVRVTVDVTNNSDAAVDVGSAVVTLMGDGGDYGVGTTAGSPSPLEGTTPAGGTARGTYVFMLDPAQGREVTINVNYAAGEPVAVFTGRTA